MQPGGVYQRLIAGQIRGPAGVLGRAGLAVLSGLYRLGVAVRNYYFDTSGQVTRLPVPVISVGNVTVGGVGKTPFAAGLFARLEAMGHHPAVLIRGYRARRREPGDEACELVELTNSQRVVQGRDRVASGEQAIERLGADVLLLDDGFQHRRLHRDLDIVLIDCTNPFGYGHLLPRGLLREPISSLMRADLLVLTRADLVGAEGLKSLHAEMAALAPGKPVIEARHRPVGLEALNAPAPELRGGLSGRAVVCFAGIGNAEAFRATAVSLGSNVVACRWWPDHHRYQPADAAELCQLADRCGAEVLLTSYKDLLKLRRLRVDWTRPVLALRIGIDLRPDGDTILTGLLRQVLGHG